MKTRIAGLVLLSLLALSACSKAPGITRPGASAGAEPSSVGVSTEPRATNPGGPGVEPLGVPVSPYPIPFIRIVSPRPSALFVPVLQPDPRLRWQGLDPNPGPVMPFVRYAYRLIAEDEPGFALWLAFPDSLRRVSQPFFEGWTLADPSVTEAVPSNLVVGRQTCSS